MTRQRKNRAISMLLVVVMVLGMIPMITKAAEEPKVESSMKLEHAFDFSLISALCHSDELGAFQNYYTSPVTRGGLGKNPLEWTLLSYAMEFGQNIDLELWRLPDSYQNDERNPIQLSPNTESDAPEEFLEGGVRIGYLNGYKIEDHLEEVGDRNRTRDHSNSVWAMMTRISLKIRRRLVCGGRKSPTASYGMTVSAKAQLASVEDANGGVTSYTYDANSNQASVTDAEGNTTSYTYDKLDRVDSWEITRYQYDGRGLTTKMTDALGNVTTYTCDGDENLVSKTDADRFTTEYTYNRLDMVTHINYNGGKQVYYAYNAVGDLVRMED